MARMRFARGRFAVIATLMLGGVLFPLNLFAAVTLTESATDGRVFTVRSRLTVEGTISIAAPPAGTADASATATPPKELKMSAEARLDFLERRIAPAGKDADSLRSFRHYQLAESTIDVAGRKTQMQLPDSMRGVVAEGQRSGVRLWSPQVRLNQDAIELLKSPGDDLALLGLLPAQPVEVDATWQPEFWVLPLLTGVEAVSKNKLDCRMEKVDAQFAIFAFQGEIEGAIQGAATRISVSGQVAYDLKAKHVRQAKVTQTEERSTGAVSPGMKVSATIYLDRQPSSVTGPLTDAVSDSIPINPTPEQLALTFETPTGLRFLLDRNWALFHQNADVAVLRLVEEGSLIAQCNVSPVPSVAAGSHTPDEQFTTDIRTALGAQLQKLESAETLKSNEGQRLYRVVASGQARNVAMRWVYYLCTAPSGRQAAMVFSVEASLVERLADRDRTIVESLEFIQRPMPGNAR